MGDAARSRPYEACLRLVVSNFAQIAARAARKELVEHLAAMASWQTITADQAESLVNKYDRRVEDSSHNQQQQGALVLSRPELSRKRT